MKRKEILESAIKQVDGSRENDYGKVEDKLGGRHGI